MFSALATFTITVVAYPTVSTKLLVYLTGTAILTVTAVILCTFKAHLTFVAPILGTRITLVADIAL